MCLFVSHQSIHLNAVNINKRLIKLVIQNVVQIEQICSCRNKDAGKSSSVVLRKLHHPVKALCVRVGTERLHYYCVFGVKK